MGKKAERRDSYSACLLHIENMLPLRGSVASCYSHENNLADCLFLIFRKNFWVAMMDMKIKRRLDEAGLYVGKK